MLGVGVACIMLMPGMEAHLNNVRTGVGFNIFYH
jgi:hypothetical protein